MYADKQLVIRHTEAPNGLSFTGVIDLFNVDSVAESLNSALDGEGDLHIDVSRLEFCDVSGIRALVSAAESVGGRRRLVLHGLPPQLRTVMTVVGWTDLPGLVIGDAWPPEK
jgi:anti-anti-sigma regulatory factor